MDYAGFGVFICNAAISDLVSDNILFNQMNGYDIIVDR